MPILRVCFTRADTKKAYLLPVERGDECRSEELDIGAASTRTTLTAGANEGIVSVVADTQCYIAIAEAATASAAESGTGGGPVTGSRYLPADIPRQFSIEAGQSVACIGITE